MQSGHSSLRARLAEAIVRPHALGILFIGLALITLGGVLRWQIYNLYSATLFEHHDAHIPLKVLEHIKAAGWLDTNWAHADLPEWAGHDQYNFSSYIVSFAWFEALFGLLPGQELSLFSIVCWLCFIAISTVWATRAIGFLGGAIVLCGLAVTPLLVQDSFYGRPESFLTLLTVLCFVLSARNGWTAQIAASVLAGFALACKISFAPFLLVTLAAPIILRGRSGWAMMAASLPASAIGFVVGAPGVVLQPGAFLDGVEFLRTQYSGFHWPFGSPEDGFFPQLVHAGGYYVGMAGIAMALLIPAAFVLLAVLATKSREAPEKRLNRLHLLSFCIAAVLTLALFSTQRTFFERNISHAVPLLWFALGWAVTVIARQEAGAFRHPLSRAVVVGVVFVAMLPMALLDKRIAGIIGSGPDPTYVAAETLVSTRYPGVGVQAVFAWHDADKPGTVCANLQSASKPVILKLITAYSPKVLPRVDDERVALVAVSPGRFDDLPFSTLQAYHSPQIEYYLLRPDLPEAGGVCGSMKT